MERKSKYFHSESKRRKIDRVDESTSSSDEYGYDATPEHDVNDATSDVQLDSELLAVS